MTEKRTFQYTVNKLLYYVQTFCKSLTKQDIVENCASFHTEQENDFLKQTLCTKCDAFISSKFLKRIGVNKCMSNINDIVECIYALDWNFCPVKFVSVDATRVPVDKGYGEKYQSVNNTGKNDSRHLDTVMHELESMKLQIQMLTDLITKSFNFPPISSFPINIKLNEVK